MDSSDAAAILRNAADRRRERERVRHAHEAAHLRQQARQHQTARDAALELPPTAGLGDDAAWISGLTAAEQRELDLLLEPVETPLRFIDFIRTVAPRYQFYWHCLLLIRILQRVADGELKRLLVFMPPRHGKSELVSRLFPAYVLARYHDLRIILACYGAELAYSMSAAAQSYYSAYVRKTAGQRTAVKHWSTGGRGGLIAAGVRGPLTGQGFDVGVVDDPVKNQEDAASEVKQQGNLEWWQSTFTTRQEPGAAIIVTLTRWNEKDLGAQVLRLEQEAAEAGGSEADRWHVVCMPAIKDHYRYQWPDTCTVEPDPRRLGEVLCRERYPLAALKRQRRTSGAYYFDALFQQRPRARDGVLFQWTWFRKVAQYRGPGLRVLYVDPAGTDGSASPDADYTGMSFVCRTPEGRFVIEEARRGRWSPGKRDLSVLEFAQDMAAIYGTTGFRIVIEQEAGVGGRERTAAMVRMLGGFLVEVEPATKSKVERADPVAQQAEFGNLFVVAADWNAPFIDEHCAFPNGAHDDWVDSLSGAVAWLARNADRIIPATAPVLGPLHNPYGGIA